MIADQNTSFHSMLNKFTAMTFLLKAMTFLYVKRTAAKVLYSALKRGNNIHRFVHDERSRAFARNVGFYRLCIVSRTFAAG
jgi:hypothetical protein